MANNTKADLQGIQTMIGKHRQEQHTIQQQVGNAQNTFYSDLAGVNQGNLINSATQVFENWEQGIMKVQNDLEQMINTLHQSANQIAAQDQQNTIR